ncbi:hypothetical protein, partial [Aeromonas hydrophila]|uniref:hypothetical protein n=1 Tax=Aeromonas hydrophila TaxID=644 RepID=UPI00195E176E
GLFFVSGTALMSPNSLFFSSRDSVKHAEPDGGHVGMGPFHPVFPAGMWSLAMSQLYTGSLPWLKHL